MKFFVPFDEALLRTHPERVGELVPFLLDYPCYRALKQGDPDKELFAYEIVDVLERQEVASGGS